MDSFYKDIIFNSSIGYAYHKLIYNEDGDVYNYKFLEFNKAFLKLTGIEGLNLDGKTIRDIIPNIDTLDFNWIKYYGDIVKKGSSVTFERYSPILNRYYKIEVLIPKKDHFITIFTDITKDKLKTEDIEQFFNINLDLLAIADINGYFIKLNKAWTETLGYRIDQLEGSKFLDLVHPDDLEDTYEAIKDLKDGKTVLNFVNRYRCKDGTYKYIEWRSQTYKKFIYAAARDITKSKNIQDDLKERTEQLEVVMRGGNIGWWDWDIVTGYEIYNDILPELLGYKLDEIDTHISWWINKIHPDDAKQVFFDLDQHFTKKTEFYYNHHRLKTKDGRWLWFADHGKVVKWDKDGKPLRMVGTLRVIDKEKRSQEDLIKTKEEAIRSKEKLLSLISVLPDIYFEFRKDGVFLDAYTNDDDRYIVDRDIFIGKKVDEVLPLHLVNLTHKYIKKTFDEKKIQLYHYSADVNGDKRYYEARMVKKGEDTVLTIIRDITDQKQAEKAIIENQRLGAIGEMASSIAHDFNNSLQAIIGNLELCMVEKNIPKTVMEYINIVKIAATDSASRVQLLQRFGGKKNLKTDYEVINFNNIIKEIVAQSRPLWKDSIEKTGSKIEIEFENRDNFFINGNSSELRSVIYNILKNSIEAMPNGGKIVFKLFEKDKKLYLKIQDSGIGMGEKTQKRIFQPFYTTKGFKLGRGLGMSSVYSILQEHQGDIYIEKSEIGKGTTVVLVLPSMKEGGLSNKLNNNTTNYIPKKLNILWVDDEEMIQNIAKKYLKFLKQDGDVVSNGFDGLKYIENGDYNLLITDIGMPNMNGWQFIEKVRKINKKIDIAVVTGWGMEIDNNKKLEYNVKYILAKPIKMDQVKEMIEDVDI